MSTLVINNKYRFSIRNEASSVLGNTYIAMEVIGAGKAELFFSYSSDIFTIHETLKQLIPNLPKIQDCMFYLFKDSYGNYKVLSDQYILTSSIESSDLVNLVITIPNVDSDMSVIFGNEFRRLGVSNFNIEIV